MSLLARLSDLIAANLNAMLDRAEDPEKLLAEVIRQMEAGLVTARQHGARAIAAERRLERELEQNRTGTAYWKDQANRALGHGREDLARRALARKIEHDDLVGALGPQLAAAHQTSTEVKRALRALEARLAEARRKQRVLLAQHHAVRVRLDVQRATGRGGFDFQEADAKFQRLENRLADLNDELLSQLEVIRPGGDLETELIELEAQRRIDEELQALRSGGTG
jgi:phage shock protein A